MNQVNKQTNIYIGYLVELIYKEGKPTLNARVRVPSVHGVTTDIKALPIAAPLITPGITIDPQMLENYIKNNNKVFVIFEGGSYDNPVYFGIKAVNEDDQYKDVNTIGPGPGPSNIIMKGPVTYLSKTVPTSGIEKIDNYTIRYMPNIPTKCLVVGSDAATNGLYIYNLDGTWTKQNSLTVGEVYSIDKGDEYGGTMVMITDTTVFEIIKNSEKFNPIIQHETPTYEEIYKHNDVWFKGGIKGEEPEPEPEPDPEPEPPIENTSAPTVTFIGCTKISGVNYLQATITNTDDAKAKIYLKPNNTELADLNPGANQQVNIASGISEPYTYNFTVYAKADGKNDSSDVTKTGSVLACIGEGGL